MAERFSAHKIRVGERVADAVIAQGARGQWLSFGTVVLSLLVAYLSDNDAFANSLVRNMFYVFAAIFVVGRAPAWFKAWKTPTPVASAPKGEQ